MEEIIQGKHFSITDPPEVNTVIYQVNKTPKEELKENSPKFTVERLDFTEELVGEKKKKTFYVDEPKPEGNKLAILSFGKERVVINNGILEGDKVIISKKPMPFKFETLYNEEETEYKEVQYTPNLYFDEATNEVKGKCKLKPNKTYFAFEIRDITDEGFKLVGGTPTFTE